MEEDTAAPPSWQAPIRSYQSHHQVTNGSSTPIEIASEKKDIEKATTGEDQDFENAISSHIRNATANGQVSRLESVTGRSMRADTFYHPLSHEKTTAEHLVGFDGVDDPYRPLNWPFRKKVITTLLYGLTTMGSTWASSVSLLGWFERSARWIRSWPTSVGTAFEVYGRKPAVLIPYFLAAMFSFGTATAKDIQTVIITQFFAGLFGSAPVTNTGGVLSDIWAPTQRGTAIVGYAFAVVGGPVLGPIVGGAIVQSYLRWRWTEYLTGIMMMSILLVDILVLDESYPPVLLVYKARRLRITTANWALHAEFEEWDVSFKEMANKFGVRPFQMLVTPICFCVALHTSFVYGIIYGNLAAFPIEFQEERGWNLLVGALPFLALLLGIVLGGVANVLSQRFYNRQSLHNGNKAVPEARLPPMMIGGVGFSGGLFLFGWTSNKSISWIAPCIGVSLIGFGFFTIFQSALNYLIDTFQRYSASAVAAIVFVRSLLAAAFPLFISPMYRKLSIPWALSVLGFFSILLVPIPFLFYIYGPRLRARGKYSSNMD